VYLLLLFGVALWSRSGARTMEGYFIAGKQLPPWVVAFSTNATGESGWLLLGLTGMGYAVGAQALWVVVGEVFGISMAWLLVSRRLKRLADQSNAITLPDTLVGRFGDRAHLLRGFSTLIIVLMVGTYVAAQMVASGKAFSGFTGLDYSWSVILGAVIIVAYTFVGGYKAVAWTDLVQGVLMWLGLIIIPIVAIAYAGGWQAMLNALAVQDERLLSPWGPQGANLAGIIAIASFLAIGWGFLGVPQLMVRFMSARSEASLVPAMRLSVFVILCFDLGAVLTGMAGRALFPGLEDPEGILPLIATNLFSPLMAGVIMVVVLAAIMSTVDSLLILASSAVVRDFMQQILGSKLPDRVLTRYGKFLTLVIGALGVLFALHQTPLVFWFVLFSWNGLGAAFGPVILCGLWFPSTNLYGAIAGIAGGFLTTVCWVLWFKGISLGLLEIIPGFIVGLVLTMAVSRLTRHHSSG
jgi:sodium/proline symporter